MSVGVSVVGVCKFSVCLYQLSDPVTEMTTEGRAGGCWPA